MPVNSIQWASRNLKGEGTALEQWKWKTVEKQKDYSTPFMWLHYCTIVTSRHWKIGLRPLPGELLGIKLKGPGK
ncbi:hypothetical protein AOLI_G00271770 [Acnodon oligacanthus]